MPRGRPKSQALRCSPLTRRALDIIDASGMTQSQLAKRAGLDESTILRWRKGVAPTLHLLEAAVEAAGHRLEIVKDTPT